MVQCNYCQNEIVANKFLLVPICHNHKIKYFCHDCCVKLLSDYLAEHVDEEYKVKTAKLSMFDSDTKTRDTFSILDEILANLVEEYKLTWYEILSVVMMLQTKILTLYIKDMHEYVAQKMLYNSLYTDDSSKQQPYR